MEKVLDALLMLLGNWSDGTYTIAANVKEKNRRDITKAEEEVTTMVEILVEILYASQQFDKWLISHKLEK